MAKKLSIGEAAKYIGVSRDTLRRWEKKGKITPERSPTNRRYYTKEQLDQLLKKPTERKEEAPVKNNISDSDPLKLAYYGFLALIAAVILAMIAQIYLF